MLAAALPMSSATLLPAARAAPDSFQVPQYQLEMWATYSFASLGFAPVSLNVECFEAMLVHKGITCMSQSALVAEKQRVERELQRYDYCFHLLCNRFPTAAEKEPMKGIYQYYSHLRERLAQSVTDTKVECERASFRPPPGLSLSEEVAPPPGLSSIASTTSIGSATSPSSDEADSKHDREEAAKAEWRIDGISEKLRLSGAGSLVSSHYTVDGMSDVRFIFDAGAAWAAEGHNRKRKARASVSDRPTYGSLKIKVGDRGPTDAVKFVLHVGSNDQGVYEVDFSEKSVHDCILTSNWVEEVDLDADSLTIRLEFL